MRKIQSLFQRNYDGDRLVRDEVVPGSEWVIAGEGIATRKFDGTCCLFRDGRWWKRYEVKSGGVPPNGFEPANEIDEQTGKQQGWLPIGSGPENRWHQEAIDIGEAADGCSFDEGQTYELCGPKINGNPEEIQSHVMYEHGSERLHDAPRTFHALREYLTTANVEGIVWHHPDGRMVKIKAKDFGIKRSS